MSYHLRTTIRSWAPVPLRIALGVGFIYHGYPKLFTLAGSEPFIGMLTGLGIPAPALSAYMIGAFEFFGGILLLLGVGVRSVSAIGALEMVVAAVLVHWPSGFDFVNVIGVTARGDLRFGLPGYEVNVLYLAAFVSLVLSGGGRFSLPALSPDVPEEDVAPERTIVRVG